MNMPLKVIDPNLPRHEEVSFRSGEYVLKGQVFRPVGIPRAIVVLNGATGVAARFYVPFATWLAEENGLACLIYDYRDFGASARKHPRESRATMADWATHDQQSARDFAMTQFPGVPVWVIGHSLGAMTLPFQQKLERIARVIAVGAGAVHVRDHPWPYQATARVFWSWPIRALSRARGFLPGRALGFGPDLPLGVYLQWRKWCTRRDSLTSDIGTRLPYPDWAGVRCNMKFVAMSDDALVPAAAVWRLMQFYPEAMKQQLVLRPETFDVPELGHINVFAERNRAAWPAILA